MAEETYKRGQVEWALWRMFALGNTDERPMPPVFRTRIKRLLEIDRKKEIFESKTVHARHAFCESLPDGKGTDISFTAFDAFCLGFALDMLDIGFKQAEIVYFLRHARASLKDVYRRIMASPPVPRQDLAPKDRPGCPIVVREGGFKVADCRVYAVIGKIELSELLPTPSSRRRRTAPVITVPIYCFGIEKLAAELDGLEFRLRKSLVFELSHAAVQIANHLREAPVAKRGRPGGR